MVDIATETELVQISGFIGKPETATKNSQQFMFVNGRFMRHPYFHKAIMTAYSGMLMPDHSPSYFLYFNINPESIDVNIHPTKTEIKFADEQSIFQILLAAAKEALGKFNVAPSLDFTTEAPLEIPISNPKVSISAPRIQLDPNYNPFKPNPSRQIPNGWEQLYEVSAPQKTSSTETLFENFTTPEYTSLFQWNGRYIVAPTPTGLMIIHQHRAHTAVLYKVFLQQLTLQQAATQPLLFPEIIELTENTLDILQRILPELQSVGFGLEQFSPMAYSIHSVPALLGQKNAVDTILQVLNQVQDNEQSAKQQWDEMIALSLADQMAIPQGKTLTDFEMEDLAERLFSTYSSRHLPNGQTIVTIISHEDIQKRF